MTNELGLLLRSHEAVSETSLRYSIDGQLIERLARDTGFGCCGHLLLNIQAALMRIVCLLGKFAHGEDTAHVTHVAKEVAPHIYHHTLALRYRSSASTTGDGTIYPFATQGKVIGRSLLCIVTGEHTAHKYLHALAKDAENTQTSLLAHSPLHLNRELHITHARLIELGNDAVSSCMGLCRTAEGLHLPQGLHATSLTDQARTARKHFGIGEASC